VPFSSMITETKGSETTKTKRRIPEDMNSCCPLSVLFQMMLMKPDLTYNLSDISKFELLS
jgi:hypothetical protein